MKRKIIIPVALVVAVAAVAVFLVVAQTGDGGVATPGAEQPRLSDAVPADTLFYAATSRNREMANMLADFRKYRIASIQRNFPELRKASARYGQAGRLIVGFFEAYAKRVEQGETLPGVPDTLQTRAYTVGIVPVLRMKLADAAAFEELLDEAEQRGGAQATRASYQGVQYRAYAIEIDGEPLQASLLVAVRPDHVVVTLDVPKLRDESLPLALDLEAPATSLAASGLLQDISDRHDLDRDNITFLNHQAIVAAVTGAAGNHGGEMLAKLDDDDDLAALRTPACREDLQAIAKIWPLTVTGIRAQAKTGDGDIEIRQLLVSEVTDPALTATLASLRGHIPKALLEGAGEPVAGLALGLDAASITPVLTQLEHRFASADFHCEWLVRAQQQAGQGNLAAATIVSGLFRGVKGVSVTFFGFDPDTGVDALIDISAVDPAALFQMVRSMQPGLLGQVELPADGRSTVVVPDINGQQVRAMIAGKHLVVFSGPRASTVASHAADDSLEPNGLIFSRIDYGKLMPMLVELLSTTEDVPVANAAQIRQLKENLRRIGEWNLRAQGLLTFADAGVSLDVTFAAKPQPAAE